MPQLSCKQCHIRKSKCDKQNPCSACRKAGIQCHVVQRARLPRGRSGRTKDTTALESRVIRLEALVHQYRSSSPLGLGTSDKTPAAHVGMSLGSNHNSKLGDFVASDFWAVLSQEVAGLRETLEDSDDDQTDDAFSSEQPYVQRQPGNYSDGDCNMLFALDEGHDAFEHVELDAKVREALLDSYQTRIDPVFKPVHWPLVRRDIQASRSSTAISVTSASATALEYAIYYLAICSLSESECLDLLLDTKDRSLRLYRRATTALISRARTLQSPDMQGLQAFVVCLQALRTCNGHALNWTLLAVAVRLATAIGLGAKDSVLGPPLILDARRRLWYSICLMDTQATLDRGAAPLIHANDLGPPPLELNDSDLELGILPSSIEGALTDMSFCTMTFEAMACFKRICALDEVSDDHQRNWEHKLKLVAELEEVFSSKYFSIDLTQATPIHILLKMGAKSIAASMRLLLRRPPYRQIHHMVPSSDTFDSMATATEILRRNMDLAADQLAPWTWKKWTPWYALAVALAELSRNPCGDSADRTYAVVCAAFARYSVPITDLDQGMLWRPITRLLRHVTKLRAGASSIASVAPKVTSHTNEEPKVHVDMNAELMDEDFMRLYFDDAAPVNYPSSSDVLGLDFDHGVSWLDWDLILQDENAG